MAKVRDEKDILEMAEAEFTRSEDKFSAVKTAWKADNDFSLGEQWDGQVKQNRMLPGKERPCLTVNKIDPLVHRIVNEAKQQKLEIKVKPVDDNSDPDTAFVWGGLIRNVEYVSKAVRAYMWAYECAVRAGLGYFRVRNEWESDDSFDQTVSIKRIKNPMCVSYDADSDDPAGRDAKVCIISDEISKTAAENLCKGVDYDDSNIIPDRKLWHMDDGSVKHMEIEWQETEDDELILLADDTIVKKSEITKEAYDMIIHKGMVKKTRRILKKTMHFSTIVGAKVIEKGETNSQYITTVRMVGREGYINGKVDYRGITRNSMDSNRMYNVMSSLLVERIGLAPRAPYIGAAGQFEGFEDQWNNANTQSYSKLEYNPITLHGNLTPPPQRNDAASGDPTIERYMMVADNDIKDTSQLSDAFMGQRSNETSSLAIKARSAQSGLATFDMADNCADSIEHGGRITLDILGRIMTTRKAVRILGEDNEQKIINLDAFQMKNGETKKISLDVGKFDVEISVSTGDKTKRETAIEQLSFVLQTNPEAANLIMDVFVGNLDIKDAKKIANRFKALLPPNVIAAEEDSEKDNPELDALQAHAEEIIAGVKAQLEEALKELQDAQLQLKSKDGEIAVKEEANKLKSRELDIKEYEVHKKLKIEAEKVENEGAEEGSEPSKKKTSKSEPEDNDSDSVQLQLVTRKLRDQEEEINSIQKQLDIVTDVLEKVQGIGQQGLTQPDGPSTEGNGLPPAEDETNVGDANG